MNPNEDPKEDPKEEAAGVDAFFREEETKINRDPEHPAAEGEEPPAAVEPSLDHDYTKEIQEEYDEQEEEGKI